MAARKVLLLGIVLLLPILAFLFLYAFGSNTYKLRTYLPERVTPGPAGAQPVSVDTVFHRVADDVALTAASGQEFNPATDLRDRTVVLAFLGPNAEADPAGRALLRQLGRVQERLRNQPTVKLLTISPEAPATLAAMAERTGAIGGKWTFATADAAAVQHLRRELRDTVTNGPANRLWLLDTDRHVRGLYEAGDPRETERLAMEIGVLLEIERQGGPKPKPQ